MPKELKICQSPTDPKRVSAEYGPYRSSYLIPRNAKGEPCAPWAIEEMAQINTRMTRMDYVAFKDLERYRSWALEEVREEIRKSTQQRLL